MPDEALAVRFRDGEVRWTWYRSTGDVVDPALRGSAGDPAFDKRRDVRLHYRENRCTCGGAEPVEIGNQDISFNGTACRACGAVVTYDDPWPVDAQGFSGAPKVPPRGMPDWWPGVAGLDRP